METIVFFISLILLFLFFMFWYQPLIKLWPQDRNITAKIILGILPAFFLILIIFILIFITYPDIINNLNKIAFYIVLGYVWILTGFILTTLCFDLHWTDDVIHLNNRAALPAITGEFIVITFIYAGANAGNTPAWWAVLFRGLIGLAAWLTLGWIAHLCTGVFERITVERDTSCGYRLCLYLLLCGGILGYACSGDWISFSMTITKFIAGWPALPLTVLYIIIELIINYKTKKQGKEKQ